MVTHEICGSFETKDEAIKVINALSLKGFPTDKIRIFTSEIDPRELAKETDGFIVHVQDDAQRKSTSKFKKLFAKITDCDTNVYDQLRYDGLSDIQAKKYTEDIRSGNILVIADNKLKMGHNHAVEFGMESPLTHHNIR